MTQTLLMDFDWTTALVRFSINTIFIASMIFIISRQTVLKRFSFTFMMISLIVFFLCYTLKNFDLNLGMALGLFAIFGIIRYRTLPLQTEEMTYLFVTIGVAVINALSEDFLTVNELIIINIIIILFILFGEIILKKLSYGHEEPKNLLLQTIGKWISNPNSIGTAFGMVGPPGVGKTLLAKSVSKALDIPFAEITLGGQNDGEILHGHGYTYSLSLIHI